MNHIKLDSDVINALKQNRKIEAIKMLRAKENIGLKEAKTTVDQYLEDHPETVPANHARTKRSYNGLLFLVAVGCLVYLAYDFLV